MNKYEQHPNSIEESAEVKKIVQDNEELIKSIIQKEALIEEEERTIKKDKKKSKQILESNTYKIFKPVSKRKNKDSKIAELEEKLSLAQQELYETKEKLNELMVNDRLLNSYKMNGVIKDKKEEGELIPFLDKIIENKKRHEENYNNALKYSARLFMKEKEEYRDWIYQKVLPALKIEDIPEFMIREGLRKEPIELRQASSFRASLNMRMRKMQLTSTLPEWKLDDKRNAYSFIKSLNVPVPGVIDEAFTLETIPKKDGIVIKPADGAGSRGVYLVYTTTDIFDIKRSKSLKSWEGLMDSLKQDLDSGWVYKDEWMIEELILENHEEKVPARDIKFYCFYGKVGLILEISRYPELKYCWWTADGKRVNTGKYNNDSFKGKGCTKEEIELANHISLTIPAPFIRIDFLRSNKGLVFGEFTPKPGNYDEFDEATDKWLGDYFMEAEGRLVQDLLNDKEFTFFDEMINKFEDGFIEEEI
ncbi:ATP-grasp fold amidoligase family protein [Paucisalibacillus sp. EB02]|uniref:ATP-grasp fold amidoligase family protein n=1 Tax=Paucisalibacillus sp. EB02 TaxID=1347087 RepID=UPI0004B84DDD|nr:ATP-grasp fold amidoligase family protein [Paucisalibacillus sp. EB02]